VANGVRRRRRRGGEVWGGVSLSPIGWGLGRGLCPTAPSPEKKLTFWLKIVHFGIYSDKNSQFSIE